MLFTEKIMLGMSGGVDSSAAAALLINGGAEVIGATMRLYGNVPLPDNVLSPEELDAANVCRKLGIEHRVIDLRKEFKDTVIEYFISEYKSGRTPNPCVFCNKNIKFGLMISEAEKNGCASVATGHYARILCENGRYLIAKPADASKDQTYMLYTLSQEQLSRAVFPLGELTKAQVRELAAELGFENAGKKDSQDICFVPDGDYAAFIESFSDEVFPAGDFILKNGGTVGRHSGHIHYTVGQRKGLGVALGKPVFVTEKRPCDNTVVLGDEEDLFYRFTEVHNVNFIPFDALEGDLKAHVKLRYRHTAQPATLHPVGKDNLVVEFETPQRAPAPGQSAVFYDGDILIGGGIIVKGTNNL